MNILAFSLGALLVLAVRGYEVAYKDVTLGYYTSGGSQDALCVYPSNAPEGAKFPLIVFSHGMGAGGFWMLLVYRDLFETLASKGYVILAHRSCPM